MRSVTLLSLFFLSSVLADTHVYWQSNLTLSNQDLKGRVTSWISIPGLYPSIIYSSVAYQAGGGMANGDGVFGGVSVGLGIPLTVYLSYFDVSAKWTAGSNSNPGSADVSAAGSFIGAAYLGLVEVNNSQVIGGIRLKDSVWGLESSQTNGLIKYATFKGTSLASEFAGFSFRATFVGSDVPVSLTNGAIVTPKSVQTTINILNYPFKSSTSTLRLIIGVGTATYQATGAVQASGRWRRLVAGKGSSAVYFDGAAEAYVDINGTTKTVTVTAQAAGTTDFDSASFLSQLSTLKSAKANIVVDYQLVSIDLPHSDNITYDPSVGSGDVPDDGKNTASNLNVQTPLLVVFAFLSITFAKSL